jgi:hypothetical protein
VKTTEIPELLVKLAALKVAVVIFGEGICRCCCSTCSFLQAEFTVKPRPEKKEKSKAAAAVTAAAEPKVAAVETKAEAPVAAAAVVEAAPAAKAAVTLVVCIFVV